MSTDTYPHDQTNIVITPYEEPPVVIKANTTSRYRDGNSVRAGAEHGAVFGKSFSLAYATVTCVVSWGTTCPSALAILAAGATVGAATGAAVGGGVDALSTTEIEILEMNSKNVQELFVDLLSLGVTSYIDQGQSFTELSEKSVSAGLTVLRDHDDGVDVYAEVKVENEPPRRFGYQIKNYSDIWLALGQTIPFVVGGIVEEWLILGSTATPQWHDGPSLSWDAMPNHTIELIGFRGNTPPCFSRISRITDPGSCIFNAKTAVLRKSNLADRQFDAATSFLECGIYQIAIRATNVNDGKTSEWSEWKTLEIPCPSTN